jgi:TolA-binding protein
MIACANHSDIEADFHCPRCEKVFCNDCIIVKAFEKSALRLCPTCDHPLTDLDPYRPAPKWRTRIREILLFPFNGLGWAILLIWPLFAVGLRGVPLFVHFEVRDYAPYFVYFPFHAIYFMIVMPLVYQVAASALHGELEFYKISGDAAVKEALLSPVLQIISPILGVFLPTPFLFMLYWSAHLQTPSPAQNILMYFFMFLLIGHFMFGLFVFPMAMIVNSVFRNFLLVVNPLFLFRQIQKISREYLIVFLIAVCLLPAYFGFRRLLGVFGLPGESIPSYTIFFIIDSELQIYLALVVGHVFGYMAYLCRFKLKWFPDTREEPWFMIHGEQVKLSELPDKQLKRAAVAAAASAAAATAGAAASAGRAASAPPAVDLELDMKASEEISRGMYLIDHGNYKDAAVLFKELTARHPDNLSALQGLIMASFRLGDHDTVKAHANKLAAEFVRQHAFEALWDMYKDYKNVIPDFRFEPDELIALARWLEEQDMNLEAARILRELAVIHPDDPRAPECLFQCGGILWKKCDKPDNAKNVFKAIIERYPATEFAEKAGGAISELESESEQSDDNNKPDHS